MVFNYCTLACDVLHFKVSPLNSMGYEVLMLPGFNPVFNVCNHICTRLNTEVFTDTKLDWFFGIDFHSFNPEQHVFFPVLVSESMSQNRESYREKWHPSIRQTRQFRMGLLSAEAHTQENCSLWANPPQTTGRKLNATPVHWWRINHSADLVRKTTAQSCLPRIPAWKCKDWKCKERAKSVRK